MIMEESCGCFTGLLLFVIIDSESVTDCCRSLCESLCIISVCLISHVFHLSCGISCYSASSLLHSWCNVMLRLECNLIQ